MPVICAPSPHVHRLRRSAAHQCQARAKPSAPRHRSLRRWPRNRAHPSYSRLMQKKSAPSRTFLESYSILVISTPSSPRMRMPLWHSSFSFNTIPPVNSNRQYAEAPRIHCGLYHNGRGMTRKNLKIEGSAWFLCVETSGVFAGPSPRSCLYGKLSPFYKIAIRPVNLNSTITFVPSGTSSPSAGFWYVATPCPSMPIVSLLSSNN